MRNELLRGTGPAFAFFVFVLFACSACTDDPAPSAPEKAPPRPSGGCGRGNPKGLRASQKITVRSVERSYELFAPDVDDRTSLPLVSVFHGSGGSGADVRATFALEAEAKNKAF